MVTYYCWWRKSCATWDVHNPVNGINYLSTGGRISSTNSMYIPSTLLPSAYANQSAQNYRTNEGGLARKASSNLYYVQMQNIHPYMIFMCSMIYGRFFQQTPPNITFVFFDMYYVVFAQGRGSDGLLLDQGITYTLWPYAATVFLCWSFALRLQAKKNKKKNLKLKPVVAGWPYLHHIFPEMPMTPNSPKHMIHIMSFPHLSEGARRLAIIEMFSGQALMSFQGKECFRNSQKPWSVQ